MSNSTMDNLLDNYVEEPWDIIQSYVKKNHLKQLVRHQIESYNDFVNKFIENNNIKDFNYYDFEIYLFMNEENLKKKVKIKLFK